MQIVSYTKLELQEFINSDFFNNINKIPISKHRAISHINNPSCANDDILLWAAYENDILMGYSSVLPDIIVKNNREEKIYWTSSVWREESSQKNTLAATLLVKVLSQYKGRLFMTDFIAEAEKSYQKLRFFKPMQTEFGYSFYRNLAFLEAIERRFPKLRFIYSFLEKCFNFTLFLGRNLFLANKLFSNGKSNSNKKPIFSELEIVENTIFDEEFDNFITDYCNKNGLVVRDSKYFNWIINYPWVLQQNHNNESKRYYFSTVAKRFEYRPIKIYDKKRLAGFIFLKIRDKHLTVSFSYLNDIYIKDTIKYILQIARSKNVDVITTFDKKLLNKLKKKYIFCRKIKKKYLFPRDFPHDFDISSSTFQEGDGDMVFT